MKNLDTLEKIDLAKLICQYNGQRGTNQQAQKVLNFYKMFKPMEKEVMINFLLLRNFGNK